MITAISTLLMALPLAQQVPPSVLYTATNSAKDQKIVLRGWGSGTISETDEVSLQGNRSLRISTRNLYQGGIMQYNQPINLTERFLDKASLLRVTFFVPATSLVLGAGRAQTAGNAAGESGVTELRMVITTTDGKFSEMFIPVETTFAAERGWKRAAFPLSAIAGFDRTNKIIKSIQLSADATTSLYLGDLRVVTDETPITGELFGGEKLNLALGDEITLKAAGIAGPSILKYEWDFDAADGIQVDAEGQVVNRKFRKPGTFIVTVTISDLYNLKEPFKATMEVKVNP